MPSLAGSGGIALHAELGCQQTGGRPALALLASLILLAILTVHPMHHVLNYHYRPFKWGCNLCIRLFNTVANTEFVNRKHTGKDLLKWFHKVLRVKNHKQIDGIVWDDDDRFSPYLTEFHELTNKNTEWLSFNQMCYCYRLQGNAITDHTVSLPPHQQRGFRGSGTIGVHGASM